MESPSRDEHSGDAQKKTVVQLIQIKYLLAGLLGLAVFGRSGDLMADLGTVGLSFLFVYWAETMCAWIPGSVSRLASISRRRRSATLESERRMRQIMTDLVKHEGQAQSE